MRARSSWNARRSWAEAAVHASFSFRSPLIVRSSGDLRRRKSCGRRMSSCIKPVSLPRVSLPTPRASEVCLGLSGQTARLIAMMRPAAHIICPAPDLHTCARGLLHGAARDMPGCVQAAPRFQRTFRRLRSSSELVNTHARRPRVRVRVEALFPSRRGVSPRWHRAATLP